jgi:hypothetical protein
MMPKVVASGARILDRNRVMSKTPHDHICAECGAIYPCPDPDRCPCTTAEERIGLCPECEPEEGVGRCRRPASAFNE